MTKNNVYWAKQWTHHVVFLITFLLYATFYRNLSYSFMAPVFNFQTDFVMILSRNDLIHNVLTLMVYVQVHVKVG